MNKKRRGNLKQALDLINTAGDIIQNALYEEQDCLDNLPENLMESDRYCGVEQMCFAERWMLMNIRRIY